MAISTKDISQIKEALSNEEIISVTFIKKNGDARTLRCCANPAIVGIEYQYSGGEVSGPSEDLQVVWSIEDDGFRRFSYSTVVGWGIVSDIE